jgi:glycosyltransferase involved in cell wall biosynthesis
VSEVQLSDPAPETFIQALSTQEKCSGVAEGVPVEIPRILSLPGAIAEIVGNAGVLVSGEDSHSLSQAILKLANDARLMKAYGEKARNQAVQHFDSQKAATELLQVYEHVHTH